MVRSIDSNVPVFWVRTMEDIYDTGSVALFRAVGKIYNLASLMGLAVVGLYAVVSYQVTQRTHEIGIRMALGAGRLDVLAMFMRRAAMIGVAGVGIGVVFSIAAKSRSPGGPWSPVVRQHAALPGVLGMFVTTLLAAAIPAGCASRVDPQAALRQE